MRGAARVSAAVARHDAQVRVDDGAEGWIGARETAQWPPEVMPAEGWERS